MMIDKKKIKMLSIIGQRAVLGTCLFEIEKDFKNLIVLSADTSTSAGLDKFRKLIPNKYLEMGISEQNMMSVAAGLSSENLNVLTATFSPFQVLRCLEQIKVNISYMNFKVTMVGLASGVSLGNLGFTHCSIEDISAILSIPNIDIVSPADGLETYKTIIECLNSNRSTYIRLTGTAPSKEIYNEDYQFKIGKANIISKKGDDIAIICNGSIASNCIQAAELLSKQGLGCTVYNFHTIRPIDEETLNEIFEKYKNIFSIEEHNIENGLGSVIANLVINQKKKINFFKLGLVHAYSKSGEYIDMLKWNKLDVEGITESVIKKCNG